MLIDNGVQDFEREELPSILEHFKSLGWEINHAELSMEVIRETENNVQVKAYCGFKNEEQQFYIAFEVCMPDPFSTEANQFLHYIKLTLRNLGDHAFDYNPPTTFSLAWQVEYCEIFDLEENMTFSEAVEGFVIAGYNFLYACINSLTMYSRWSETKMPLPGYLTPDIQTALCTLDFLYPTEVH